MRSMFNLSPSLMVNGQLDRSATRSAIVLAGVDLSEASRLSLLLHVLPGDSIRLTGFTEASDAELAEAGQTLYSFAGPAHGVYLFDLPVVKGAVQWAKATEKTLTLALRGVKPV